MSPTVSGRLAMIAVAAWLVGSAAVATLGPYARLSGHSARLAPPEEIPGSSAAQVGRYLTELGDEGRATYRRAQWVDRS